jgi:hypothetical protein
MSVPISSSSSSTRLSSGARPPYCPPNQPLNFHHQSPYIRLNYSPPSEPASSRPSRSVSISNVNPFLGDPALIHPFLAGLSKDRNTSRDGESDLGAAALHLAIRCASGAPLCAISWSLSYSSSAETVLLLLSHRSISPNAIHPPASGTTALHLAASLGRADVVNLLLEQESIDDTLRDSNGKTCIDVARGKDVLSVINGAPTYILSLPHSFSAHALLFRLSITSKCVL